MAWVPYLRSKDRLANPAPRQVAQKGLVAPYCFRRDVMKAAGLGAMDQWMSSEGETCVEWFTLEKYNNW